MKTKLSTADAGVDAMIRENETLFEVAARIYDNPKYIEQLARVYGVRPETWRSRLAMWLHELAERLEA